MAQQYGPKIITDGLVLSLDAADKNSYIGSGTTWTDLSPNGNDGTLSAAAIGTDVPGSMDFDGSSEYITFGVTNLPSGTADVSLSIWCIPTESSDSGLFGYGSATSNTAFEIYMYNHGGTLRPAVHYAGGNSGYTGGLGLNLNEWNHIAATYDKTSSRIYVNGELSITDAQALTIATTYRHIATRNYAAPTGEFFDGKISSAQIYNRALSSKEVSQNFNAQRSRFGV